MSTGNERNGSTRRWRTVRARVLRRDPMCLIALAGCTRVAVEVDHIVPVAAGGAMFDQANLQGACFHCNRAKGSGIGPARCPHHCSCGRLACTWTPRSREW